MSESPENPHPNCKCWGRIPIVQFLATHVEREIKRSGRCHLYWPDRLTHYGFTKGRLLPGQDN